MCSKAKDISFRPCPICDGAVSVLEAYMHSWRKRKLYSIGCDNRSCPNFIGYAAAYDTLKHALYIWNKQCWGKHSGSLPDTHTLPLPLSYD